MIGKIQRIRHVASLVHYLTSKDDAVVLQGDSLLADTRAEGTALAHAVRDEIQLHAPRRPRVERTAAHLVLSAPPGQQVDDDQWRCVARETLERLGYKDVPYLVIQHGDTAKAHVHVVAGTINRDGELVNDRFEGFRIVNEMREIRRELGLRHEKLDAQLAPSPRSDPDGPAATEDSAPRPRSGAATLSSTDRADVLRDHLRRSESLRDFVRRLREAGVETPWNLSPSTGHVSGVSYGFDGKLHGGRRLGKDLAYGALEKRFGRPELADLRELVLANRAAERGRTVARRQLEEGDLAALSRDHGLRARAGDVVEISPGGIERLGPRPEAEAISAAGS